MSKRESRPKKAEPTLENASPTLHKSLALQRPGEKFIVRNFAEFSRQKKRRGKKTFFHVRRKHLIRQSKRSLLTEKRKFSKDKRKSNAKFSVIGKFSDFVRSLKPCPV